MEAVVAEPKLTIRVAEAIEKNHSLSDAVKRASDFLSTEFSTIPLTDETREATLKWELQNLNGAVIVPQLDEIDNDGRSRSWRQFIPINQALDSSSMETWMLRLLRDVNGGRLAKVMTRWNKMIEESEEAEQNGA
ncbi:MAG: hypothetical protein KF873_06850 [Gemmataceae bacterium]|nr:hypothetical protein [Gemmataceae bacterium]